MLLRIANTTLWLSAEGGRWQLLEREPGRGNPTRVVGTYTSVRHAEQCARATGMPKVVVEWLGSLLAIHDRADTDADDAPDSPANPGT
jgi:hypothetical protein